MVNDTGGDATLPRDMMRSGMRVTFAGMVVNAMLIAVKLVGGILGGSVAMVADALHSLSDFISDIAVIIGLRFIAKPPDGDHAYGHGRIETAISLLMGIFIIIVGLGIFRSGLNGVIGHFRGAELEQPGVIALVMGIVSILSKEAMFQYTRHVARRIGSRSIEANAWHHRSDALSSVGTVLGIGGAIALGDRWTVLDPAAAVFVSILIMRVGYQIGWSAFRELSDESLSRDDRERVGEALRKVEGVIDFHYVRTRSLGRYVTVDAHVLVDPTLTVREGHAIAHAAENAIRDALGNAAFVTIHIEPEDERI